MLFAGSWFGVYVGFEPGLLLGACLFLALCAGAVALRDRRKRRDDHRRHQSERDGTPR